MTFIEKVAMISSALEKATQNCSVRTLYNAVEKEFTVKTVTDFELKINYSNIDNYIVYTKEESLERYILSDRLNEIINRVKLDYLELLTKEREDNAIDNGKRY